MKRLLKTFKNKVGWNTPKHFLKFMTMTRHIEYGYERWDTVLKMYKTILVHAYILVAIEKLVKILNKKVIIKLED